LIHRVSDLDYAALREQRRRALEPRHPIATKEGPAMTDIALAYNGPINTPATTKLRSAICGLANRGTDGNTAAPCQKLWLLLNSSGGNLDDGLSLYNLLRTLKIEVVTVNMGQIASIANVVFIAGKYRIACPESYFHFHGFDWNFAGAHTMTKDNIDETTRILEIHRNHKKALFKARTTLTDADFEALKFLDEPMVKDASFALEKGIVQEIAIPNLPAGTPIYNVEY
jgi:ATP-dependent Clp protease protease subunit